MGMNSWKRHFKKENLFLEHDDPPRFVQGPWRRKAIISSTFLIYRILIALALIGTSLWSMTTTWNSGKWFIYLTNWGYMVMTIQTTLAAFLVAAAFRRQKKSSDESYALDKPESGMPFSYKIYWLIYNVSLPSAFFITILYWSLIYDPNKITTIPVSLDLTFHAGNSIAALLELVIGGPPSRLLHGIYPAAFGIIYLVFNVTYWAAGGTDVSGNHWIYPVLKWEETEAALTLVAICTVLIIILHVVITLCAGIRHYFTSKINGSTVQSTVWTTAPSLSAGMFNKAFVKDVP